MGSPSSANRASDLSSLCLNLIPMSTLPPWKEQLVTICTIRLFLLENVIWSPISLLFSKLNDPGALTSCLGLIFKVSKDLHSIYRARKSWHGQKIGTRSWLSTLSSAWNVLAAWWTKMVRVPRPPFPLPPPCLSSPPQAELTFSSPQHLLGVFRFRTWNHTCWISCDYFNSFPYWVRFLNSKK